ncbi:MAG TPA: diacylglycerol kinase family protein [Pseudogracilibacillus sp.]|nr:diacylglycerol kinase family protein [Pseudogracilibacillus sp.]
MNENKKRGIGLKHALNGVKEAFKKEKNFRIHIYVAVIIIFASIYFQLSKLEWIIVLFAIQSVFITELMNSIAERIIDYVKPAYHPKAKLIKDIAAAVVFITAVCSVIIGCLIFVPKILP